MKGQPTLIKVNQNTHSWSGSLSAAFTDAKFARSWKGLDLAISVIECRADASWVLSPLAIPRSTTLNRALKFSARSSNERLRYAKSCWQNATRASAIHRVKGIKEETVMKELEQAAGQVEMIEKLLLREYHFTRAQMDALWTYVGHKGEKGDIRKNENVALFGEAQL